MRNTLEQQKNFPIIAWAMIIGLVLLTYYLVVVLKKEAEELETVRTQNETALERDLRFAPIKY